MDERVEGKGEEERVRGKKGGIPVSLCKISLINLV